MPTLKVVVVDDEPLARERLARLLIECGCEVITAVEDAPTLLEWLGAHARPDVIFLDIQMPGGTGLEALAEIRDPPPVVFVTAFAEHALRAFEVVAFDYILKPVFKERLEKTLQRLKQPNVSSSTLALEPPATAIGTKRFPVKAGDGHVFLELRRVSHFELDGEIVWVWSGGKRFRTSWTSLNEVLADFPDATLLRAQRHILLRPESVIGHKALGGGRASVRVGEGVELEVSRSMTPKLRRLLGLIEMT
jgi:DNA-binding LytR/AlgR family response regulator